MDCLFHVKQIYIHIGIFHVPGKPTHSFYFYLMMNGHKVN